MQRSTKKTLVGSGAVVAAIAMGGSAALASSGNAEDNDSDDGTEVPITGDALERASTVALAHTGEGQVTETEIEDEESYYEVEVTLDNGSEVDVQLDEAFNVVGQDIEGAGSD